jgi:RNA polymerase sigma factor (sigma-70 family)
MLVRRLSHAQRHPTRLQFVAPRVHNTRVTNPDSIPAADLSADAHLAVCVQTMAQFSGVSCSASPDQRASAERALSELYDCTVQRVHALVRRFVHDASAAQEVTEDVFYQAWTQAARFDPTRGSVTTWLFAMARGRALDAWRRSSAQLVSFDSDAADNAAALVRDYNSPCDLLAAADHRHALHAALAQLSPLARQMLSLAFFQGLTHSEISAHMRTPLGTVKTTIRRALLTMRESLRLSLRDDLPISLVMED